MGYLQISERLVPSGSISFNVGGTGSSVNIQDSKCFTAGTNTVTFTDGDHKISTTVNFPKTPQSSSSLVYFARVIPSLDKLSSLVVASQCTADMHPVCSDFQQQKMM